MTTPDTLASLIAKMPHTTRRFNGDIPIEHWAHVASECDACQLKAALDALVALANKWRVQHADENWSCMCEEDCADELEAELRGRVATRNGQQTRTPKVCDDCGAMESDEQIEFDRDCKCGGRFVDRLTMRSKAAGFEQEKN